MKQEMFRAADGATFHGGMTPCEDGLFEVWCYAQRQIGGTVQTESKHY